MGIKKFIVIIFCSSFWGAALADGAKIESFRIEVPGQKGGLELHGKDARQQILVTAKTEKGSEEDLTHKIKFETSPSGIVEIQDGRVIPKKNGESTIVAESSEGARAELK